jgi:hypothetical protein
MVRDRVVADDIAAVGEAMAAFNVDALAGAREQGLGLPSLDRG